MCEDACERVPVAWAFGENRSHVTPPTPESCGVRITHHATPVESCVRRADRLMNLIQQIFSEIT